MTTDTASECAAPGDGRTRPSSAAPPAETLLKEGSSIAQPDILLISQDGQTVLAKDFSARPLAVRRLFGRHVLRHEADALARLQGIPGIPAIGGMAGKDRLLMQYVADGGPLRDSRELDRAEFPPLDFFLRLRKIVATMHGRGLAHGDIRRRNILQGKGDQPFLVDFATAVFRDGWFSPLRGILFGISRRSDIDALIRLQHSFYPDSLPAPEREALANPPWYLLLGRFLRKRVYRRYIKQKTWRERVDNLLRRRRARRAASGKAAKRRT